MASLREAVKQQQEELRDGIAWVAFWREGRSWNSESFHLEMGETLYSEDKMQLAEIQATDPKAVVVNGYYSGYLGEEMSVDELAAGVRHHYENGLSNIAPFMEPTTMCCPRRCWRKRGPRPMKRGCPFMSAPIMARTSTRMYMTAT